METCANQFGMNADMNCLVRGISHRQWAESRPVNLVVLAASPYNLEFRRTSAVSSLDQVFKPEVDTEHTARVNEVRGRVCYAAAA